MKVAILGDTHFGARSDAILFHDHFRKFYEKCFLPYLVDNGIKLVFQLGDLFDKRKQVNFQTLFEARDYFFDPLTFNNIELHTLVGNHDIFWRESLEVNAQSLLLNDYHNVIIHEGPASRKYGDNTFDFIPWICEENKSEVADFIRASKSDICMGHFEIAGFSMYKGAESHDGLSREMFEKYEQVWSGHYHTRSKQDNITYVGTPYEMTWQDFDDPKGFHVFDTETRKLEFIKNPYTMYSRIEYDDTSDAFTPSLDEMDLKDKYVRLVVVTKTDLYKFDQFVNKIHNMGCYDLKIIEDLSEFTESEVDDKVNLEDTVGILSNYIDKVDTDMDKEKIKSYMKTLYTEAVNMEVV